MTDAGTDAPGRRAVAGTGAAALVIVAVTALTVRLAPTAGPALVGGAALAAGCVALATAPRLGGADRRAWTLIGLGQLVAVVGAASTALASTSDADAQLLHAALAVVGCALTVAGLLCFVCQPGSRWSGSWLVLDVLTVTATLFVVAWGTGLQRQLEPTPALTALPALTAALELTVLVVASLAVVAGVRIWRSRTGREQVATRLAVLAMACAWLAASRLAGRTPEQDRWLVLVTVAASALFLAAPAWVLGGTGRVRRPVDPDHAVYAVVLLVAVGVPVVLVATGGSLDPIGVRVSAVVVVVLVLRLLVLALRGRRLAGDLAASEEHFRSMVQSAPDLLVRTDLEGRVVFVSLSVSAVFGLSADRVVGKRVDELVVGSDVPEVRAAYAALARDPRSTQRLDVRVPVGRRRRLHLEALANRLDDDVVFVVRDVTERVRLQQELVEAAYRDALTGLPNRQAFDLALAQRLGAPVPAAVAARGPAVDDAATSGPVAVIFCDLDGFKGVNDTSGHATGDRLLGEAGSRVREAVRPGDLATRFGGDEFTVLLAPGTSVEQAVDVASAMIEVLARPYLLDGREFVLGATAGVALARVGSESTDLVRDADLAMYRAKDEGRGRVRVFEPQMLDELRRRVELERRLHHAIVEDGLSLLYQPVVDLGSGAVSSAEALLRWSDGDQAVLAAPELVALAEASGRIQAVGTWVLERAVEEAASWEAAGHPVGVAVNLSVTQLGDPSLVSRVDRVLRVAGVPPERLTLEITESVLLERSGSAIDALERLCGLGVHLAVDDFGTGYSALEYLRRLPVDQLKVDRSFVQGLGQLDDVTALLRSVVGLGHDLGMAVTVEGVETVAQVRLLRQMRVQRGQGYVFARPLDSPSMLECLQRGPFVLDAPDGSTRLPRVADQGWPPADSDLPVRNVDKLSDQ